jgi:hypothetical protein
LDSAALVETLDEAGAAAAALGASAGVGTASFGFLARLFFAKGLTITLIARPISFGGKSG